jgi:hypothetical protein
MPSTSHDILCPSVSLFLYLVITLMLPSCAMYLNYGSKLKLVNSVLSSLPIFSMSTLKGPG